MGIEDVRVVTQGMMGADMPLYRFHAFRSGFHSLFEARDFVRDFLRLQDAFRAYFRGQALDHDRLADSHTSGYSNPPHQPVGIIFVYFGRRTGLFLSTFFGLFILYQSAYLLNCSSGIRAVSANQQLASGCRC